jgi:hypothetical protein
VVEHGRGTGGIVDRRRLGVTVDQRWIAVW